MLMLLVLLMESLYYDTARAWDGKGLDGKGDIFIFLPTNIFQTYLYI